MAKGQPAGRLSIELVAEIARLQTDLDKAKRMVKAASGDIAASAKAANDNLRAVGAGGSPGLQQFSRDVIALKGQLDPAFASLQRYKQQVELLRKALGEGAITHKQFVEQMRVAVTSYKNAGSEITKTTGSSRNFMLQMSQVAQQVSAGTGVLQALAIQLPDIAAGMSAAGAGAKGFAGFLAGPWGLAVTASLALLVPFVSKLWESGTAAEKSAKSLRDWSKASTLAEASKESVEAMQKLGAAQAQFNKHLRAAGEGFRGTDLAKRLAGDIAEATSTINFNRQMIARWNKEIDQTASRSGLIDRIASATDKVAAATKRHEKAMEALDLARQAGKVSDDEYVRQGIALQKQLDLVKNADREAAKAKREHAKATREATKAQKEYEKSLLGRVESGSFVGQIATEFGKSRDEFMKAVAEQWKRDLRETVGIAEDAQKAGTDERIRQDEKMRRKLVDVAHDFADIVGGRLGQAVANMAQVLDRVAKDFSVKLGSALSSISSGLGAVMKSLGAGATIGTSVAGLMKSIGLGKTSTTGAAIGGAAGMAIGGPVGAIAGSILGGVVGGLMKKTKKASATIEIMAGEAMQSSLTGNSAKLKKVAGAMADGLIGGLTSIADQLGGMLGDGIRVSIGQRNKSFRVDLQGLGRTKNMPKFDTEEEAIAYAIQEVIKQGAIIGLRAGTEALLKGEGDLEAQLEKAIRFENVFKELAERANPARASIEAITKEFNQLIDIFDEAKASTADYAQLQELMAIKQREVIEQAFEPIRSLLDELKSKAAEAGDAVRSAYERVLSREADAVAAYEAAVAARRQKTIDALSSQLSTLRDQAQGFADAASKLRDFSAGIFGTAGLASLRATFDRIARLAQGGDMDAMGQLTGAGQALRDAVVGGATDRISMVRELNRIRVETDKAATVAEGRASTAERQAAAIEKQLSALQAVDQTTDNIEQLLADMQTAQAAADAAREQMKAFTELAEVEQSFSEAVAAYEAAKASRDDLLRDITTAGFADLIEVQKKTGDQLISALQEVAITAQLARTQAADAIAKAQAAAEAAAAVRAANDNMPWLNWMNGIPGFASGGNHRGGLRVVGEETAELEMTGPSRIFSADQIAAAIAGNSQTADEVAALRSEMRSALYQIAKNTGKTTDQLRRWDGDGMPEVRDVA